MKKSWKSTDVNHNSQLNVVVKSLDESEYSASSIPMEIFHLVEFFSVIFN